MMSLQPRHSTPGGGKRLLSFALALLLSLHASAQDLAFIAEWSLARPHGASLICDPVEFSRGQSEGCFVVNAQHIDAVDSPCMVIFAAIYCPDAAGSCEIGVCDPDLVPYSEYMRVTCNTWGTDEGLIPCCE